MRPSQNMEVSEKVGHLREASRTFLNTCCHVGKRLWPLATNSKPAQSDFDVGILAHQLVDEKFFLLSLVHGMETEFLATGEGLKVLAQQLNETQRQCESLIDLTLGRSQDAAVPFAFQQLKKAEDLVLACYDQYDHVFATFGELQRRLSELPRRHDDLMRALLPLNFVTTLLRIEASRQPVEIREIFFTLATNISRTVNEVRRAMERQFEGIVDGEQIARDLMGKVSNAIHRHRKEVKSTLETSRNQLRDLDKALMSAGAGAKDLSNLNRAVTRHIGSIVMAQQCQDITRQKIDHIGEAMDEMCAHLDNARSGTYAAESDPREFIGRAANIQVQQVRNVFDELNRAADCIKSGVRSLRTEAGTATEAAVRVGMTALESRAASQCETSTSAILAITQHAVQQIADILAALEPLQTRFINCTSEAIALGIELQHVALNAQVFAIHAPDGATLEVLAGRLRVISDETIQQVEQLEGPLEDTTEMIDNLRQRLVDFQQLGQAEQKILGNESELSRTKLAELEGSIPIITRRITEQQGTFVESVNEVLENVRFPVAVAEASSRSIGFFQDLVDRGRVGRGTQGAEAATSKRIDRLKSNYTMESERSTHTMALRQVRVSRAGHTFAPSIESFGAPDSPASASIAPTLRSDFFGGQSAGPCHTMDAPACETAPPALELHLPSEKPAANAELGGNVELF